MSKCFTLDELDLERNSGTFLALLWRQKIEALKSNDPPPAVLDENDVVPGFFANVFLLGIIEPHV